MSEGHMILIGQDNAGDCLIMSGDVPRGLEMDIGCHGYDSEAVLEVPKWVAHHMTDLSGLLERLDDN